MIGLKRGEPYPLPIAQEMGAAAQFLTQSGNILQIVLPDMDAKEQNALRSGMIKAGFLYEGGAMLFMFQFYGNDGKPLLTFDAPFDIRLLPPAERNLHSIDNAEQRLAIDIHAIDEKKILRALRLVTMPPDMTLKFLSAIQDQLAGIDKRVGKVFTLVRIFDALKQFTINAYRPMAKTRQWVIGNGFLFALATNHFPSRFPAKQTPFEQPAHALQATVIGYFIARFWRLPDLAWNRQ
jgi:hypothetical protein